MNKKLKIGIIGFGGIAEGAHLPRYKEIPDKAEIYAVCDISEERLKYAGELLKIPEERRFTDYNKLIESKIVDAVDICTPNDLHCKIAHCAIEAGIPFSIEKPVGLNYDEVLKLYEEAKKNNVTAFVCLSYRYFTHARYIRDIVKKGNLGKIYHIYIRYLKDSALWDGRKLEWRFDKKRAGTGVLGDLGVHMLDFVRFLGIEFDGIYCQCGTVVKERLLESSDTYGEVTTDDWTNINAMSTDGIPISINITRAAKTVANDVSFEIIGENGRIKYSTQAGTGDEIEICIGEIDTKAYATHNIIPPHGYSGNQSESFINLLNGKKDEYTAELTEGLKCQKILEAAEISAKENRYVKIEEVGE